MLANRTLFDVSYSCVIIDTYDKFVYAVDGKKIRLMSSFLGNLFFLAGDIIYFRSRCGFLEDRIKFNDSNNEDTDICVFVATDYPESLQF